MRWLNKLVIPVVFFMLFDTVVAEQTQPQAFEKWLVQLHQDGIDQGLNAAFLDSTLKQLEFLPKVLEREGKQAEKTLSYAAYRQLVAPQERLEKGRELLAKHGALLEEIGRKYKVQPRFIVALWGMESDFGRKMGDYSTLSALATLAYKSRRNVFFKKELLAALKLVEAGHVDPKNMVGSWAGATGQCQFMPSNILPLAVDYDGDERRDIWQSKADIFASIANFLSKHGWRQDQTWGRQVQLPSSFDQRLAGLQVKMRLRRWHKLGLKRLNGANLPRRNLWSSLLIPDGTEGPAFLIYDNFHTTMRWNRSTLFALTVGYFSEQLKKP